jgi:hypothetical protein
MMRRIILALAISAIATTSVIAASAAASGPAVPGKELIEIECSGLGTITVSVPRPAKTRGAGQIVGQKGHGILVSSTFTLADVTTSNVISTESVFVGGGNAHPNQATTTCSRTFFEGEAATFFEGHEPEGVAPTDIVRAGVEIQVIPKK